MIVLTVNSAFPAFGNGSDPGGRGRSSGSAKSHEILSVKSHQPCLGSDPHKAAAPVDLHANNAVRRQTVLIGIMLNDITLAMDLESPQTEYHKKERDQRSG